MMKGPSQGGDSLCRSSLVNPLENEVADMELSRAEDHVWFEDRWMVASLCDE
jgi:hypothetical protein